MRVILESCGSPCINRLNLCLFVTAVPLVPVLLAVDELPPEFEEAELLPIGHIQRTTEVLLYFFRWRFRFAAAFFLPFFRLSRFFPGVEWINIIAEVLSRVLLNE